MTVFQNVTLSVQDAIFNYKKNDFRSDFCQVT